MAFFSAAGEISTSGSGTWATRSTSCSLTPIGLKLRIEVIHCFSCVFRLTSGDGCTETTRYSALLSGDAREGGLFGLGFFLFSAGIFCPKRCRTPAQDGVKAMNHASASAAGELSEPESRHLAPEEVLERLDSLSAEDKRRLRLIEWRRLSGTDLRDQ